MFDYSAFRTAFETRDVDAWLGFYAENAEWIEYRHDQPPKSPRTLSGRAAIAEHLQRVKASDIALKLSHEIVGEDRVFFRVWVDLSGGRRIIEHALLELDGGRIVRQTDVEAWDT